MKKKSTFDKRHQREPQAVELRYGAQKEWALEGNRTLGKCKLVAVDGYCARKNAERMMVRKSGLFSQFGWHRGRNYRPEEQESLFFGFSFSPTTKESYGYEKRNPL